MPLRFDAMLRAIYDAADYAMMLRFCAIRAPHFSLLFHF